MLEERAEILGCHGKASKFESLNEDVLTEFCCYRMFQVQLINSNSEALSIRVSTQPLDQFCILVSINHTVDDSEFCYAQVGYLIVLVDVAAIGHPNSQIKKLMGHDYDSSLWFTGILQLELNGILTSIRRP